MHAFQTYSTCIKSLLKLFLILNYLKPFPFFNTEIFLHILYMHLLTALSAFYLDLGDSGGDNQSCGGEVGGGGLCRETGS